MSGDKCVTLLVVVTFLLTPARGDVEVSCVFMESCILPCGFQASAEVVIHWIQMTAGDPAVHAYYRNQDQLSHQDQHFRSRTSLFKDQISRGNASLRLTGVEFQDEARYKCYTSTIAGNKESFINLKVYAPVRKVDIQQVENEITCISNWIFPKPELTWTTGPQSNITIQSQVKSSQTEQKLYNISSSLTLSDNAGDLTYTCTVSTQRNSGRATLRTLPPISGSVTKTIRCPPSNISPTSLVWRFNHTQTILTRTGAEVSYNKEWRPQVKGVSESGDLMLQDLSSNQEGIYTCELSNAEETNITNTFLRIENSQGTTAGIKVEILGPILAVLAVVAVVVVCLVIFFVKKRKTICEKFKKKEAVNRKDSGPSKNTDEKKTLTEMQCYSDESHRTT